VREYSKNEGSGDLVRYMTERLQGVLAVSFPNNFRAPLEDYRNHFSHENILDDPRHRGMRQIWVEDEVDHLLLQIYQDTKDEAVIASASIPNSKKQMELLKIEDRRRIEMGVLIMNPVGILQRVPATRAQWETMIESWPFSPEVKASMGRYYDEKERIEREEARRRADQERQSEQARAADRKDRVGNPEAAAERLLNDIQARVLRVLGGDFHTTSVSINELTKQLTELPAAVTENPELNKKAQLLLALHRLGSDISRPRMNKELIAGTSAGPKSLVEKLSDLSTYEFSTKNKRELPLLLSQKGVLPAMALIWEEMGLNLKSGDYKPSFRFWNLQSTDLAGYYQELARKLVGHRFSRDGGLTYTKDEAILAVSAAMGMMIHSNEMGARATKTGQLMHLSSMEMYAAMNTSTGIDMNAEQTPNGLYIKTHYEDMNEGFLLKDGSRTAFKQREVFMPELGVPSWVNDEHTMVSRCDYKSVFEMVRSGRQFSFEEINKRIATDPFFKYQKKMGAVSKVFGWLLPSAEKAPAGGYDSLLKSQAVWDVVKEGYEVANSLYWHLQGQSGIVDPDRAQKLVRTRWMAKMGMNPLTDNTNLGIVSAYREASAVRRGVSGTIQYKGWDFEENMSLDLSYKRWHYQDIDWATFLEQSWNSDPLPDMQKWLVKFTERMIADREYMDLVYLFKTGNIRAAEDKLDQMKKKKLFKLGAVQIQNPWFSFDGVNFDLAGRAKSANDERKQRLCLLMT